MKSSCIEHPKRERLLVIHKWQLEACDSNACAAALLSFFEYWHNIKVEQSQKAKQAFDVYGDKQDDTLWQFHTEEDLEAGILIYRRTAISAAIKLLESKKFLVCGRNPNPKYRFDRTRFFMFCPDVVNSFLESRNGAPSTENGSCHPLKTVDPSVENGSAITETTSETTSENKDLLFDLRSNGNESGSNSSDGKKNKNPEAETVVRRVFAHFLETTDRNPKLYTLTPQRLNMGIARLRDCYKRTGDFSKAEEIMLLVVDALQESDFHNARGKYSGQAKYNEWKHLFRSTDKMEEWIERSNQ